MIRFCRLRGSDYNGRAYHDGMGGDLSVKMPLLTVGQKVTPKIRVVDRREHFVPRRRSLRENQVATLRITPDIYLIGSEAKLGWESDRLTSSAHKHSRF